MIKRNTLEGWTTDDEELLKSLVKKRMKVKAEKGHDLKFVEDLLIGEEGERKLVDALTKGEVKRDFGAGKTGNVFLEVKSHGRPSGITTTDADYWFFVLDGPEFEGEVIVGIKTDRLREISEKITWVVRGGEKSHGKLIPLRKLIGTKEIATARKERTGVGKCTKKT